MPPTSLPRLFTTARTAPRSIALTSKRTLTSTIARPQDYKSTLLDKDAVNPTSSEYSKSGGDQQAAHEDVAFDPETTSPETQHDKASQSKSSGDSGNPLNVSPGNPDVASWKQNSGRNQNESEDVANSPKQQADKRKSGIEIGGAKKAGKAS